jgi:glutathione S-transferase
MSGPAVPTLSFAPQTCARVALTALAEIGLPFQTRVIAFLAGEHRQPAFLAINPSGKVPALQTSSGTVVQTGAILNYLAETWPAAGLLPIRASAIGRAQVQAQLFRCSSDLHPLVTRFVMAPMISTEPADAVRVRERAREVLTLQLAPLDALLSGRSGFWRKAGQSSMPISAGSGSGPPILASMRHCLHRSRATTSEPRTVPLRVRLSIMRQGRRKSWSSAG